MVEPVRGWSARGAAACKETGLVEPVRPIPVVGVIVVCIHMHEDALARLVARADRESLFKAGLGRPPVAADEVVHPLLKSALELFDDILSPECVNGLLGDPQRVGAVAPATCHRGKQVGLGGARGLVGGPQRVGVVACRWPWGWGYLEPSRGKDKGVGEGWGVERVAHV